MKLFRLAQAQPWLSAVHHQETLEQLMDECSKPTEAALIADLLSNFNYLSTSEFSVHLKGVVESAFEEWGFLPTKTQIVASHPANDPDSSQLVMQMLKPVLARLDLENVSLGNKIHEAVKKIDDYPMILVVDEFVGTGMTMLSRIKDLTNRVAQRCRDKGGVNNTKIGVGVVASMAEGLTLLRENGVLANAQLVMNKGISDAFAGTDISKYVASMERLESGLADFIGTVPLPNFGHGRAESLYALEGQNVPNSVFPLFWWSRKKNNDKRQTLFSRFEN